MVRVWARVEIRVRVGVRVRFGVRVSDTTFCRAFVCGNNEGFSENLDD
jgi:hypothetical protein